MKLIDFFKSHRNKKLIFFICIGVLIVGAILIAIIVLVSNQSKKFFTEEAKQLELADDSEASLTIATQHYNLDDSTPTFDLYGETGYVDEGVGAPSVMLRSDYSPDAEPCNSSDILSYNGDPETRKKCIGLSKEKLVIPNHATLQTYNGAYKKYHNADKSDWDWVDEYAYAFLPDGSMISMANTKIQFNFYDNETRIVQMSGTAYYRVKMQPENYKFTVQVGDRIIELSDAEIQITLSEDKTAKDIERERINDLYLEQKENEDISYESIKDLEAQYYNEKSYIVDITQFAGTGKMYKRGGTPETATYLDIEDNSYKKFAFSDSNTRESTDVDQKTYEKSKETLLSSYSYTVSAMFSENNYGLGNFNFVDVEDLYNMLMVYIDNASIDAYTSAMQYQNDMDEFTVQWNNFMQQIGTCEEGWYKTATGTCCPDGTIHDPDRGTCTKTTYYYYCEEGWTLEADNMCHKQGSSSQETYTPTYNPGSGSSSDQCVDNSKPASFQLCKMGVSTGSSHMQGSKCCFDQDVPSPQLELVN